MFMFVLWTSFILMTCLQIWLIYLKLKILKASNGIKHSYGKHEFILQQ